MSEIAIEERAGLTCPTCGDSDHLIRNETVAVSIPITSSAEDSGGFNFDNDSDTNICWETAEWDGEIEEFQCNSCHTFFDAPDSDSRRPDLSLSIPLSQWNTAGVGKDPNYRMITEFKVNGFSMHLEAVQVIRMDDGSLIPHHPPHASKLTGMRLIDPPEGQYKTMIMDGREYVVLATPFQEEKK